VFNKRPPPTTRTLNKEIGILLASYTRAINKQEKRSGSLFRKTTKAECIDCHEGISPSFITNEGITQIDIALAEKQYPQICFDYIHQNPVKANLVTQASDWAFSSAKEYAGLRNGNLVNIKTAAKYIELNI
jgi:putative transposase